MKTRETPGEGSAKQGTVGAFEAKTHFSALLERAHQGEEIVITRRGEPFAKLGPIDQNHDVEKAREAMRWIRERAREMKVNLTPEEIKASINEGRRY